MDDVDRMNKQQLREEVRNLRMAIKSLEFFNEELVAAVNEYSDKENSWKLPANSGKRTNRILQ